MTRQLVHGLVLETDLPVGDEQPSAQRVDLELVRAGQRTVPVDLPDGKELLQTADYGTARLYSTVLLEDDSYLLRLHGALDVALSQDLRTATWWQDPSCPEELAALLVAGNVIAVRSLLAGELVLHAGAVEVDGRSLAFVAPSGVGKSTLSTMCSAAGAKFVTDDVLRLSVRDGTPVEAFRGSSESRLRRDLEDLTVTSPSRRTVDERTAWMPPRSALLRTTLRAVVLPTPRRDLQALEVERLTPGQAIAGLVGAPRILGWRRSLEHATTFRLLAQLVADVPVYRVGVPWGPPFPAGLGQALLALLG